MPFSLSSHCFANSQIIQVKISASEPFSDTLKGFVVNNTLQIDIPQINSQENCQRISEFSREVYQKILNHNVKKPLRLISTQFSAVDKEWDVVQDQHFNLLKYTANHPSEFQASHLCFSFDFGKSQPETIPVNFNTKMITQLLKQFNTEAWVTYCSWFNEGCERVSRTFAFEASEEYQLQALLEDFSHEVRSPLLYEYQESIFKNMQEQEIAKKTGDRNLLFSLEKMIVSARLQLVANLQTQSDLLVRIVEGISKIEELHPELEALKNQAVLLSQLVLNHLSSDAQGWSWEKWVIMMQLLDEALEILPVICYESGDEPATSVLGLRLSVAEIKKSYSFVQLLKTCLEWDQKLEKESPIRHDLIQLMIRNTKAL